MSISRDDYKYILSKTGTGCGSEAKKKQTQDRSQPVMSHTALVLWTTKYISRCGFPAGKIKTRGTKIKGKYIKDIWLFKGVADVMAFAPMVSFFEIKIPPDDLSSDQKEFRKLCIESGTPYHVIRKPDDLLCLIKHR